MVLHHTADAWTIPIDLPFYHHDDPAGTLARRSHRVADAQPLADQARLLHAARGAAGVPHDVDRRPPAAEDPRRPASTRAASAARSRRPCSGSATKSRWPTFRMASGSRRSSWRSSSSCSSATCSGLLPSGASPTGNLAVTGALAILVFLVIEIGGHDQARARRATCGRSSRMSTGCRRPAPPRCRSAWPRSRSSASW